MVVAMPAVAVNRVYHPWHTWECYKAGFFTPARSADQLRAWRVGYRELLTDIPRFHQAMERVLHEWPNSVAHNLTNEGMNRIAWLGQSSCCITFGAAAEQTRSAFNLLSTDEQDAANAAAALVLFEWLRLYRLFRSMS